MGFRLNHNRVFVAGGYTEAKLGTDNTHLFTLNKNALLKVLNLSDLEKEPDVIDICESPSEFTLSEIDPDVIYVTSKAGDLFCYNIKEQKSNLCFRSPLPLRDLSLIHDEKVCVVGGDDLELTLVALEDGKENSKLSLDDQLVSLSYNKQNNILAVCMSNGNIDFYSLSSTVPNKVNSLSGYLPKIIFNDDDAESEINTDSLSTNGVDGLDTSLCQDNRTWTKVVWSNKGDRFVIPTKEGELKLFLLTDYSLLSTFRPAVRVINWDAVIMDQLHTNTIAAVGNTDKASHLFIWNLTTGTQMIHEIFNYSVCSLCWRINDDKSSLTLIMGTWSGDVITFNDILEIKSKSNEKALFLDSDDEKIFDNDGADNLSAATNGKTEKAPSKLDSNRLQRSESNLQAISKRTNEDDHGEGSEDIDSENLFTDNELEGSPTKRSYNFENEDDFIEDDNGEGALYKKPKTNFQQIPSLVQAPRFHYQYKQQPQFQYRPFSSGATPFGNSDKRYLTINQIGHVWTTRNEGGSNSITVSFFDLSRFREYHFDDLFKYDLCSLTEDGVLLGQSKIGQIHYRSHTPSGDSWTKNIALLSRERLTSIACTAQCVIVGTSFGYLRTFNQFGLPLAIEKMSPIVALTSHEYRVFTIHYSQYHGISYSIFEQNPQIGNRYYQRECPLPITLPQWSQNDEDDEEFLNFDDIFNSFNPLGIKAIFFSSFGDPCVFGHDNVLLVLSKWRTGNESRWVPIVDTNLELWKMSGGKRPKDVHIWPLGLNFDTFSYLLLKGKNCWPDIPMTVPSEMEVRMPILPKSDMEPKENNNHSNLDDTEEIDRGIDIPMHLVAEEEYLRSKVLGDLLKDTMDNEGEIYGNESELLQHLTATHDKSLLRIFAYVCAEQDVNKALSVVQELKQDKALTAARKIAERAELLPLVRKINSLIEAKFESDFNNM